ncbi:MarR family transcriptional regulator [Woodsholea maritima]|uniref:MarR family transcriptional regulator n=1 Tax=Woodsholea maritima TaxID=240237 RepID=UPI0003A81A68|nr:MarR family transcriptional regulator [Woodsholea maritima]
MSFKGCHHDANKVDQLVELFHHVMMRAQEIDQAPRTFNTGVVLHRAEIHTLQAIGDSQGAIMKDLAERMGVTRGAMSQMARRLEDKGLITRQAGRNSKEIVLVLSALGEKGVAAHKAFHRAMYQTFRDYYGPDMEVRLDQALKVMAEMGEIIAHFADSEAHEKAK